MVQFSSPLPTPGSRVLGAPDPAGDMNQVLAAIAELRTVLLTAIAGTTVTPVVTAPQVAVSATGDTANTATLLWRVVSGTAPITAVQVGRDGTDSTSLGAYSETRTTLEGSITFDKLVSGQTYKLSCQPLGADTAPVGLAGSVSITIGALPAAVATTTNASATAGDATATLNWSVTVGTDGLLPTQCLVGRNGVDSTGYGAWSEARGLSGAITFNKLVNNSAYTLTVQPLNASGGSVGTAKSVTVTPKAISTPTVPVTPTPVPTGQRITQVGASGLPFNHLAFTGGWSMDNTANVAFENWLGRSLDGLSFCVDPNATSYQAIKDAFTDYHKTKLLAGRLIIIGVPPAPPAGTGMWAAIANGSQDAALRDLGATIVSRGMNLPNLVLRVGWESNGDWYRWSHVNTAGSNAEAKAATIKAALQRYSTQVRAGGATNVRFSVCWNKGPDKGGVDSRLCFPGRDYIDIIGVDHYDQYPKLTSASGSEAENLAVWPSVGTVPDFARANNVMWSIDEFGVWNPADANHGGDNPLYHPMMMRAIQANMDILAWAVTYNDDGAPDTAHHKVFPNTFNPLASAKYKLAYPNGWG